MASRRRSPAGLRSLPRLFPLTTCPLSLITSGRRRWRRTLDLGEHTAVLRFNAVSCKSSNTSAIPAYGISVSELVADSTKAHQHRQPRPLTPSPHHTSHSPYSSSPSLGSALRGLAPTCPHRAWKSRRRSSSEYQASLFHAFFVCPKLTLSLARCTCTTISELYGRFVICLRALSFRLFFFFAAWRGGARLRACTGQAVALGSRPKKGHTRTYQAW